MNVLGFSGSTRRGSNTDILLAEVLKGATSRGAETKTVVVPSLHIVACQNCDACLSTGACPFGDDMVRIYRDLAWADRIVLAAPLHFMGLPSQTKALVDRTQALWVKKYLLRKPPLGDDRLRCGLFVSVGGRTGERLFEGALATVRAFFASLDAKYVGMVAYAGVEKRAEILTRPEALQEAFVAGESLVGDMISP
ncbi:MAG: flavodoxin family protein [Dehalococcoidia bacterium]|nr:flavodoxin family protein [Dehalococcoidia bacterium]